MEGEHVLTQTLVWESMCYANKSPLSDDLSLPYHSSSSPLHTHTQQTTKIQSESQLRPLLQYSENDDQFWQAFHSKNHKMLQRTTAFCARSLIPSQSFMVREDGWEGGTGRDRVSSSCKIGSQQWRYFIHSWVGHFNEQKREEDDEHVEEKWQRNSSDGQLFISRKEKGGRLVSVSS